MRLLLPDLLPGRGYAVEIRSDDGTHVSEWSPKFELQTDIDAVLPLAPTGLTWVVVGDSFHGEWNSVITNVSGDLSAVVRYEVELVAGTTVVQSVPQKTDGKVTFDLPFEQNRALFGTPQGTVAIRVRAVDSKNSKSAWTTQSSATNPIPAAPTAAAAVVESVDSVGLSWTAPVDNDIIGYNIYGGLSPSPASKIAFANSTTHTHNTSTYSLWYFLVKTVDKFNQESAVGLALQGTPKSAFLVDTTPPAVPVLTGAPITTDTFGRARSEVAWTHAGADLAGFNIRYRKVGDTNYLQTTVDKDSRTLTINLPIPYVNYEFQIRAYDFAANYSAWSGTTTSTGSTNAVPAVTTGLVLVPGRDSITASWTEATEDDVRNGAGLYEVQIATNAGFSTGLVTYRTGANSITISGLAATTAYWVRVRAVDSVGGVNATYASSNTTTVAFPLTPLSDGQTPGASPTPTVFGGIGYLYVSWTPVTVNAIGGSQLDLVTYEVHISTTGSGFTANAGTKIAEVSANVVTLEKYTDATALLYGTTYYVKTIAKDRDGPSAAGTAGSGTPLKAVVGDIILTPGDIGAPTLGQHNTSVKTYSVEYSLNASETVAPVAGWSTTAPTRTPGNFIWTRTVITYQDLSTATTSAALLTGNSGATGSQGIPGTPGANGTSLYTWLKYADTPTTGMSDSPAGKTYIGLAVNQVSSTESVLYGDYIWSLIQGPQGNAGIPGTPGADGVTTYTWVKYADDVVGTGLNDSPVGKTYIGFAFNKTTAVESSTPGDYSWALIQGPQGVAGTPAAMIDLTATTQVLTSPAAGGATTPATAVVTGVATNTTIDAWTYSVDGAAFSATVPGGVSRTGNVVTITGSTMTARTIAVKMANTASGIADTLTVAKAFDGATGSTGGTGGTGPAGADAYTVLLSNESQTFAAGLTNAQAATATSTVIAYKAAVAQVATVGTITGGATGISAAVTNNGTTAPLITFTVTTALVTANGTFTVPVTVAGITFTQVFTWSLSFTGSTGSQGVPGTPAAMIDLTATSQVLTSPAIGGTTNPATSTVTGTPTNTTITAWTYSVDGAAFSGTVPAGVSRTGNVVTITGSTMTARTIAVKMADAAGIADTLTVAKAFDGATGSTGGTGGTGPAGADAYTVLLTNESQTFAAGLTNAQATSATSTVMAYKGAALQTATVGTITGGATGITAAVTNNATTAPLITFTVTTALATPNGTFLIPVTVAGITFNQVFAWSLSFTGSTGNTGAPGAAAANVTLISNAQVLAVPAGGGATTPTTSTVTGTAVNTTITAWTYSVDGAAFSASVPTGVSRTGNVVTITGGTMTAKTIAVQMADAAGISDTLTVAKVSDGATGSTGGTGGTGPAGADAYTILLSNESHVFPGSITAALAGSTTTTAIAYKLAALQTATIGTITGQVTGLTTNITNNSTTTAGVTITVTTALVTQNGTLLIPITVGGIVFNQTFSWSVAYAGATGGTGGTGPTGVGVSSITPYFLQQTVGAGTPATPTASPPTGSWVGTEPAYVASTELWRTERVIYTNATFAYTTPTKVSSYEAAVTISGGKNRVTYSTSAPGSTANTAGDTWFQRDVSSLKIIAQFEGLGGTSWISRLVDGVIIANLDAGRLTAGTIGTQLIQIGAGGSIQSTDFATGSAGWKLSTGSLEIVNGIIRANTIISGTGIINNLTINTGGTIQSSVFDATTGFKLDNTGLTIRGTGNLVDVAALTAGTITGKAIIIGTGGSFTVDSTAVMKSNNYSGSYNATSGTGWQWTSTGLIINDGQVSAKALETSTLDAATITLGSSGIIQSSDYAGGTAGFKLDSAGLVIRTGQIEAASLRLQIGQNIMPYPYAGFEFNPGYYTTGTNPTLSVDNSSGFAVSVDGTNPLDELQSLKLVNTSGASRTVYLAATSTTRNVNTPDVGKYIISAYFKPSVNITMSLGLWDGTGIQNATTAILANVWTRVQGCYTVNSKTSSVSIVVPINATVYVDSIQLEYQTSGATTASTWKPPSTTTIDGSMIKTGSIISNQVSSIVGVPQWSINMSGAAAFSDMLVRGNTVVGSATDGVASYVQSYNYVAGVQGWMIDADGNSEFRQMVAESITGDKIKTGTLMVDRLAPGTTNAAIRLDGALTSFGVNGEQVGISGADGFYAYGSATVLRTVTNKALTSNVATLTTSAVHGWVVGDKISITGMVTPFVDGTYVITVVPTTTTLSFDLTAANVTSVASGGTLSGPDPDKNVRGPMLINFPTDGSQPNIIAGALTASTVLATAGITLRGASEVESNAIVYLGGKVNAPKAAPVVAMGYSTISVSSETSPSGLCRGHTSNWYVIDTYTELIKELSPTTLSEINYHGVPAWTDGIYRTPVSITYSALYQRYYVLALRHAAPMSWSIMTLSNTFTKLSEKLSVVLVSNVYDSATIGYDHQNNKVMVGYSSLISNLIRIDHWGLDASGLVTGSATVVDLAGTSTWNVSGVGYIGRGFFDYGVERIVVATANYKSTINNFYSFSTAGVAQSVENWPKGHTSSLAGGWFDTTNSRFYGMSPTKLYKYEGGECMWTAGSAVWWAGYSWKDTRGGQETNLGPRVSWTMLKRTRLTVTTAPVPIGTGATNYPNQAKLYIAKAQSAEQYPTTPSAYVLRIALDYPLISWTQDSAVAAVGGTPPTANNFPNVTTPGKIESATGLSYWSGDDTAKFQKLVLDSTTDASVNAGNTPALRIGNIAGIHLRIDGNEIICMSGDATQNAVLYLNLGAGVKLGGGDVINGFARGVCVATTDANGDVTITHGLGGTPTAVILSGTSSAQNRTQVAYSYTSTTFKARVRSASTAAVVVSGGVDFDWVAFR